jgi:carbonic anhydrase
LVISYKLLGTREWFVIHHTDCGMLLFTNDDMRSLLASSLKTATLDQSAVFSSKTATRNSIAAKLKRGSFPATFLVAVMAAIGRERVDLADV